MDAGQRLTFAVRADVAVREVYPGRVTRTRTDSLRPSIARVTFNRAAVAFLFLTGSRETAAISIRLSHIDLAARCIHFDGRTVDTKFGKSFTTTFFPVGEAAERIVAEWVAELRRDHIGFVYQFHHLLPDFSALENVVLPQLIAERSRAESEERARELLSALGLAQRTGHRPSQLSGGEQQRVAVARALVGDPALVLADEPTGNLDSTATEDALALIDELHEQGRTIVLITHEAEVAQRARRTVRVRDGRVQQVPSMVVPR